MKPSVGSAVSWVVAIWAATCWEVGAASAPFGVVVVGGTTVVVVGCGTVVASETFVLGVEVVVDRGGAVAVAVVPQPARRTGTASSARDQRLSLTRPLCTLTAARKGQTVRRQSQTAQDLLLSAVPDRLQFRIRLQVSL
jgi:hypothetical protein